MSAIEISVLRAIVIRRFCINAREKNLSVTDETDCPVSHRVSTDASQNNRVRI